MPRPLTLKKLKLNSLMKTYRCPFHYRGLECKNRKWRNTWSNKQIWPSSTEWSRAKVNRVLPRERTGHSKHPLPTTQEKTLHMEITNGRLWNQIHYIQFSSVQFISVVQSCPTLCDPINCSAPGLPAHHQLLEFTQTHVHCVSEAIQPFHPLSSPSSPVLNLSQHHDLFR